MKEKTTFPKLTISLATQSLCGEPAHSSTPPPLPAGTKQCRLHLGCSNGWLLDTTLFKWELRKVTLDRCVIAGKAYWQVDELKDTWSASEAVDTGDYSYKQHQLHRVLFFSGALQRKAIYSRWNCFDLLGHRYEWRNTTKKSEKVYLTNPHLTLFEHFCTNVLCLKQFFMTKL